ncbi:hypothetical protein K0C01_02310 [Salinarchaeum sp. IM2453]|uniref:hypothetical protein n=1 Tax=Salinarchaeum sp. IM2453 TaxID=2862870 RepID=UPI001C830429|nr:hypothetical protein [Salinarchaeum sp. IM2453]QZA89019.1 hypothetical protein K0C01_02310 [Salinarchaeum sp. IM2453]
MSGNEDLQEYQKQILQTLSNILEAIESLHGTVKKIPEVIEKGTEAIQNAIDDNTQAQAELKLMEHMMEVQSVEPQIEAEREQLSSEKTELEETLEQIENRYQRKHDELDEKAQQRVRNLGSHIFEINEQEFEDGIEDPFTQQVTDTWDLLQSHNETVRKERNEQLRETAQSVAEDINNYVKRKEDILNKIDKHRFDPDSSPIDVDTPEPLQLCYYVVEYEIDGVTERTTVVPSKLSAEDTNEWYSVSLSPVEGIDEDIGDTHDPEHYTPETVLRKTTIEETASKHGDESLLGLSYESAVTEAVPEGGDIPVRTARGEE